MIRRLLVANRGEIARRVFRTCRDLGIETVAVHSDDDAGAPYVREADAAVHLPGSTAADTYLRGDLLVAAARQADADAVHPGYGFLAESASFARAVVDAGLVWVGPPPAAVEAMGSKIEAKRLMAEAGVPVLPRVDPEQVTPADFPLLVKASAGGGGRGMRAVHDIADLAHAVESARREAESAFGDPAVFCEPLLERSRHIEVQVLADMHGTVWTLGERECSIQRRHQKIVEETPSPAVDDTLRKALCDAAARAASAIGYVGAGTVEFLLGPDGAFYFLEMNTRLQVEHPVTECAFGLDLVRLQVEVAEGEALPPEPPASRGHAIEVRLYAEDPAAGWAPQSGRLHRLAVPDVDATFANPTTYGLRLDSGVEDGSTVGVSYDPMLAKVIAWAPTRQAAARRLGAALAGAQVHGLTTNRDLLVRVLTHPRFLAGDTDTGFLEHDGLETFTRPLADGRAVALSALAAALADAARNRADAVALRGIPGGWRNVASQPQRKSYDGPGGRVEVAYRLGRDGLEVEGDPGVRVVEQQPHEVVLEADGLRRRLAVAAYGEGASAVVHVDSSLGSVALRPVGRFPDPTAHVAPGSLLAPMPGTVVRVAARQGDRVTAGQPLVVLEAMKMEHVVTAPADGTVTDLSVETGQQVETGQSLAVITPPEEEP
ncbi:MAG TPA: biotin carboxylase N-terminal domain-containing protein [Actinomycetes bacterium]